MKSLRELYRIGIGPSSSHTMGPHFAAQKFHDKFPEVSRYRVTIYGSLAATGKGHFTDRAILSVLGSDTTELRWEPDVVLPTHPNGLKFEAMDCSGNVIGEEIIFSIGGGALLRQNESDTTPEIYPFKNFQEILEHAGREGQPLWHVVEEYENDTIWEYLSDILAQMKRTIKNGLSREEVIPGGLFLARRAASVYAKSRLQKESRTGLLAAYALASSEENASFGTVVTAPTCGSCGILPAVLYYLQEKWEFSDLRIVHSLATAGLIGLIAKQNGSISGAEAGCQAEVGVACAMASGAIAQLLGGTLSQIEYAAEMGLEHFLGLTCDPVLGLVQIPCIERNVMAANKAMTAAEYALLSDGRHRVSLDCVIETMKETGHDLPALYRETSRGGLAKAGIE